MTELDYLLDEPDYRDQEEMQEAWADMEFADAMEDFSLDDYYDIEELSANRSSDWENGRDNNDY